MFKNILFCIFCFFYGLTSFGSLDSSKSLLSQAETFYDAQNYEDAAKIYEKILEEEGSSGEILFNLGNTYFRLGKKGKAIAAYLGAKRLSPRDPDITKNLKYVESFSKDKLTAESQTDFLSVLTAWSKNFTWEELVFFSVVFWIIFIVVLLFSHVLGIFSSFRPLFLSLTLFFSVFSLIFFWKSASFERWGAVTSELVSVHSGPFQSNTTLFELHEGAPLLWKDSKENWIKVELSDGKKGWLESSDLAFY